MNATLDKVIGALRQAGLEFSAENLADSLWLAPHLPRTPLDRMRVRRETEPKPPVNPPEPKNDPAGDAGKPPPASREAKVGKPGVDAQLPVTARGEAGAVRGMPVRLPGAASLPEALAIARALRPLRRRMATTRWFRLDEKRTAERLAAGDVWQPVLLPGRERWLNATVVVDAGASMAVWRSMVDEFRAVLQSLGAFRRIEVRRLDTDGKPGEPVPVYASRQSSVRHDPRDLADPSGRTFFLVVSDCVGGAWWDGRVARLLERWGRTNHAAVLQILPRTLWGRTALGAERAVSLTSPRAVCPNANLAAFALGKFRSNVKLDAKDAVPVPVLELGAASLAVWARDAASATGARFSGRLLRLNPAPAPPVDAGDRAPPLGEPFLTVASVPARRLANLMATAPPFNLPLLRVIRESRLSGEATQIHEAEFLLGGLLTVASGREERIDDPDRVIYDFKSPELRRMLRSAVPVSEAIEVLRLEEVGEYLGRHLGRPGGFSAMFRAPENYAGGLDLAPTGDGDPIARFTADMLRWFGGKYAELVSVKRDDEARPAIRVLVAGTGDRELPGPVLEAAERVGRWAAERGYGLVTGGWPGVDHVAARAFAAALDAGSPIDRWLTHVVRRGAKPDFQPGGVIEVEIGRREYEHAIELANAAILVGGLGGTSNVARLALEMRVPVFPLPWTEGDAANVYLQVLDNWTEYDWMGLSRDRFAALSNPSSALDIVAEYLQPTRKEPEPPQVPDTVARMLFVASKPPDGPQVLSDEELGAIGTIIGRTRIAPLRFEYKTDVTWEEFRAVLASLKPNLLHFCGHSENGHLAFRDGAGESRMVDPEAFADALATAGDSLRVIVLNADETGAFATAAMKRLPGSAIVATERVVTDERAIRFAGDFYGQLADGHSVRGAFKYASQPQPGEGPAAYSMWSNEADADRMTVRSGFLDGRREPIHGEPDDIRSAISQAKFALDHGRNPTALQPAIRRLEAVFRTAPNHRAVAILLGRLHRAGGQFPEAIAVLTSAIAASDDRGKSSDDVADLLYNRACYHALLLQNERAFEDLIRSVRLSRRNADAARTDGDFQSLHGDRRFAALLDNPRPHRILIVGSRDPRLPPPAAAEFAKNCRHLGSALARAGFGFVLGSFSEDTADHHVLRGLAEAEGPVNIAFIRPRRRSQSPELEEALTGHLVERTLPEAGWTEVRPLQFQAADLILAIGGGEGTRQILDIARTASQPLIPIQAYPGAAREAWPAARQRLAKAGISIPLIDRLNREFDVGAIVETVRACLSGPLRDPDGLLPMEEIHRIVLESENLRDGETITGELLLFESLRHRQHTWLVATADHVFILLDDETTREQNDLLQWRLRRTDLLPLAIDPAKRTVGFAARPKPQWYYSTVLFPSPRELEEAISSLVEGRHLEPTRA